MRKGLGHHEGAKSEQHLAVHLRDNRDEGELQGSTKRRRAGTWRGKRDVHCCSACAV